MNPKDLIGSKKVSITKFPAIGLLHGAHAMMDGARKYGAYNWRDKAVQADIYVDAAMRHLQAWFEGEESAVDSGVHHLGHAMACCAILLDAQENGKLIDNRPANGEYSQVLDRLGKMIKHAHAGEVREGVDDVIPPTAAAVYIDGSPENEAFKKRVGLRPCWACGSAHSSSSCPSMPPPPPLDGLSSSEKDANSFYGDAGL